MHPRSIIRRDVRAALVADVYFTGWTVLKSWGQSIDTDTLPAVGVFTPREQVRRGAVNQVTRDTDVAIQARRQGGDDLEDALDDDSEKIETLVLGVLGALAVSEYELTSTDIDINHDGAQRVGRLNMIFRATRYTPEGLAQ
jgi:hypothetical protein